VRPSHPHPAPSRAPADKTDRCFCGNALQSNATLGQTGCDHACSGDSSQVCGGANRLSVYRSSAFVAPAFVPAVAGFAAAGCFAEGRTERALAAFSFASANMTVAACVAACAARDYALAGLEFRSECYCADALSNQTVAAPLDDCRFACAGDRKTFCGGADRILVYARNEVRHVLPRASPPSLSSSVLRADFSAPKRRRTRPSPAAD